VGRKLLRDITGSILVEYTIVFPVFILLVLGTVDVAYMLSDWALANKAAYVGARTAVVADAVANGLRIQHSIQRRQANFALILPQGRQLATVQQ